MRETLFGIPWFWDSLREDNCAWCFIQCVLKHSDNDYMSIVQFSATIAEKYRFWFKEKIAYLVLKHHETFWDFPNMISQRLKTDFSDDVKYILRFTYWATSTQNKKTWQQRTVKSPPPQCLPRALGPSKPARLNKRFSALLLQRKDVFKNKIERCRLKIFDPGKQRC